MVNTPTIKLALPGLDSPANIKVIDDNMKIIDEWAKTVIEKIVRHVS